MGIKTFNDQLHICKISKSGKACTKWLDDIENKFVKLTYERKFTKQPV